MLNIPECQAVGVTCLSRWSAPPAVHWQPVVRRVPRELCVTRWRLLTLIRLHLRPCATQTRTRDRSLL